MRVFLAKLVGRVFPSAAANYLKFFEQKYGRRATQATIARNPKEQHYRTLSQKAKVAKEELLAKHSLKRKQN